MELAGPAASPSPQPCAESRRARRAPRNPPRTGVRSLFQAEAGGLMSPVTHLALDMDQLAGLGSDCETPKRNKKFGMAFKQEWTSQDSVSSESSQDSVSSESADSGVGPDSPVTADAEVFEDV
ncbi:UNVERIFIED_CONTAM: hypothetical protein K2H54_005748 [Gekko kuhli]